MSSLSVCVSFVNVTSHARSRVEWVPHRWLAATTYGQLRNFLIHGSLVQLLPPDHEDVLAARAYINDIPRPAPKVIEPRPSLDADGKPTKARDRIRNSAEEEVDPDAPTGRVDQQPDPVVDAEVLIPKAWQTVDRVLEVWLWKPIFLQEADKREKGKAAKKATKAKLKAQPKPGSKIISDEEDDDELEMDELDSDLDEDERNHLIDERINREARLKHGLGKKPANGVWESIQEREARTGNLVGHQDIEDVIWCYIKWQDLEFEQGMSHLYGFAVLLVR